MAKKILIIDDDPTTVTLVSFLLKSHDFEISVGKNGKEGLTLVNEQKPDLIVLDVMMPEMDGYTFLRELKKINFLKIPPVIVLTSKDQMEYTFRMEGVKDYFVKPLDAARFLAAIKSIFSPNEA